MAETTRAAILLDVPAGELKKADLAAVTMARADTDGLTAMVFSGGKALGAELQAYGVTRIIEIKTAEGPIAWHPDAWAAAAIAAVKHFGIQWLVGVTRGRELDLLPRIAAGLKAPLVLDALEVNYASREVVKSQFSGRTRGTFRLTGDHCVVGVRPNAMDPTPAAASAEVISFEVRPGSHRMQIEAVTRERTAGVDLTEAEIIISGGRAMANRENFALLEACAATMGAAVGASRAAVDSGYAPHTLQVGQTGATVSPKVYIACGISGAVQHFAGMKTAKTIVAINTDPGAAMVQNSDYAIIGDLFEIVPLLTAALEELP